MWLRRFAVILLSMLLILLLTGQGSETLEGFHNQHHHGRLHSWYQKLMRPDVPAVSCCNNHDCTPTQARQLQDGTWQAKKAGRWVSIPESKINVEESVDTQAHICWMPHTVKDDSVLCFVKPGMAL